MFIPEGLKSAIEDAEGVGDGGAGVGDGNIQNRCGLTLQMSDIWCMERVSEFVLFRGKWLK